MMTDKSDLLHRILCRMRPDRDLGGCFQRSHSERRCASARLDLGLVAHITATGAELSFLSLVYICSEIIQCTMYM